MSDFYNYRSILSRNAAINLIVGGRGIGKTYGAKAMVLHRFLKYGDEFIYLRRYKNEQNGKTSFLADLPTQLTAGFRVRGNFVEWCKNPDAGKKTQEWVTAGYFAVLSTAGTQKSVSYPKVRWIIFDEAVLPPGGSVRYLAGEVKLLQEFYNTVDRYQDRTRLILLGNAATIMCPYFAAWDVVPDGREWYTAADGFVCAHYPPAGAYGDRVMQTKFGKFIRKTDPEYAAYAIGNVFSDASPQLLEPSRPSDATYIQTVVYTAGKLAFWRRRNGDWWATTRLPGEQRLVTREPALVDENTILMTYGDGPLAILRWAFNQSRMRFASARARNIFIEAYNR